MRKWLLQHSSESPSCYGLHVPCGKTEVAVIHWSLDTGPEKDSLNRHHSSWLVGLWNSVSLLDLEVASCYHVPCDFQDFASSKRRFFQAASSPSTCVMLAPDLCQITLAHDFIGKPATSRVRICTAWLLDMLLNSNGLQPVWPLTPDTNKAFSSSLAIFSFLGRVLCGCKLWRISGSLQNGHTCSPSVTTSTFNTIKVLQPPSFACLTRTRNRRKSLSSHSFAQSSFWQVIWLFCPRESN